MPELQSGIVIAHAPRVRALLLFVCLLLMTGCDEAQTSPTAPLDAEFTLPPGEGRRIEGESVSVTFVGVSGDSRCPADAICVLGGSATVKITVASGFSSQGYDLLTGDMRPVVHDGLTIALVQLSPYPFSARTIAPDEYRATLKVTR
jgi:hypothetical protein